MCHLRLRLRYCLGLLVLLASLALLQVEGQGCPELTQWQCDDGGCINNAWGYEDKCDGERHCEDGSDEHPSVCGTDCDVVKGGGFACADGQQCVRAVDKCNGVRLRTPHCADFSDESANTCGEWCKII